MSVTATTIRMDSELKRQFDSICDELGMSSNTAFNIFAKVVMRTRRIPFKIERDKIPQNAIELGMLIIN